LLTLSYNFAQHHSCS